METEKKNIVHMAYYISSAIIDTVEKAKKGLDSAIIDTVEFNNDVLTVPLSTP